MSLGYSGSRGDDLSYGGSSTAFININQLDPKYLSLGTALTQQVPNPFVGIPEAGPFATSPTIRPRAVAAAVSAVRPSAVDKRAARAPGITP